jgi:uncharacterized protein
VAKLANPALDPVEFERNKIKGAIRTDFILSAEIIVLTLGVVAASSFVTQVVVVAGIALLMTVGVYGLVACIVKLDDAGLHLMQEAGEGTWPKFKRWLGERLLNFAPRLMKALSVVGTAAMFMVGGGILVHGLHFLDDHIKQIAQQLASIESIGPFLGVVAPTLLNAMVGIVAGAVLVGLVTLWQSMRFTKGPDAG